MKHNVISVDLAKNVFQVCALGNDNEVVFNRKVKRNQLLQELRQYEPTVVAMEACYSSNPWGREIEALGHEVRLVPPFKVKPFVVGNKNDHNDALAIAEAALRPTMRFVKVKTLAQQDIQTVFRIRERVVRNRTGLINQIRGLLSEYGVVAPKAKARLRQAIPAALESIDNQLTVVARRMVARLHQQWLALDEEHNALSNELESLLATHPDNALLRSVPGIGPIGAALIIASVGDASQFRNGRQLAAWAGLTPKQHASGDLSRIGGISKRGNGALRKTLIHGARTVLNWCQRKDGPLSRWLQEKVKTRHPCKVVVALANKLARIIWAVLKARQPYDAAMACH